MRQLTAGLLALMTLLGLTAPGQAQATVSPTVTPSCTAALANAQKRIESGRQLKVEVSRRDLTQSHADHPPNRSFESLLRVRGPATGAIMSSPKFRTAVATDIIQACDDVSLVTFGVTNSAYEHSLGLMPNGQVKAFECLEPTRAGKDPIWGQTFCP